jgi:hypothetical protein
MLTGSTGQEFHLQKRHISVGDQITCRITKLLNTNIWRKPKCQSIASGLQRIDFCTNRVILPEDFATLYTTIEESLEDLVAKYKTFIKTNLL